MTADIKVQKSADIGLRQARIVANLSLDERFGLIAEGLPIILHSAQDLIAASTALAEHPRAAQILERHGEEEAAKILILLDYVRSQTSPALLRRNAAWIAVGRRLGLPIEHGFSIDGCDVCEARISPRCF